MISRRTLLAAPAAVFASCGRRRGAGFPGFALVANREARTLAAVDLTGFALARHIPLDAEPAAVLAHPARPLAWVLTPHSGVVHEIEAQNLRIARKVQAGHSAVSMRLDREARALWVLCHDHHLVRLELEPLRVAARIPLPGAPVDFDVSADGRLAAASFADGAVAFIDLAAGRAQRAISFGRKAGQVRFRSDGRQLLVADPEQPFLSILEAPGGRVVVQLPIAVRPENLCFKSDGGQLFISGAGMDAVVIIFPYKTEVAETVLAGKAPGHMAASTAPDYLFVANPPTGDVTILDIETRRAIAVVAVGEGPAFITLTPDHQYALVLNRRSGNMAVIRIANIVARRTKSAALFTMIPVGSGPVSAAVCRV